MEPETLVFMPNGDVTLILTRHITKEVESQSNDSSAQNKKSTASPVQPANDDEGRQEAGVEAEPPADPEELDDILYYAPDAPGSENGPLYPPPPRGRRGSDASSRRDRSASPPASFWASLKRQSARVIIDPLEDEELLSQPPEPEPEVVKKTVEKIVVGTQEVHCVVSSRHMMLASPHFQKILSGTFKEAWNLRREGHVTIRISEDVDLDTMIILLNIIHGASRKVPRQVSLEELSKIAVLVSSFGMLESVEFFSDTWIDSLEREGLPKRYNKDVVVLLFIFWVFDKEREFRSMTRLVQWECDERLDVDGKDVPISGAIIDAIKKNRESAIQAAITIIHDLINRYLVGQTLCDGSLDDELRYACDSMVLGSLMKSSRKIGIWPQPEAPFDGKNFKEVARAIRDIRILDVCNKSSSRRWTSHGPSGNCHGLEDDIDKAMKSIETGLSGLELSEYVRKSDAFESGLQKLFFPSLKDQVKEEVKEESKEETKKDMREEMKKEKEEERKEEKKEPTKEVTKRESRIEMKEETKKETKKEMRKEKRDQFENDMKDPVIDAFAKAVENLERTLAAPEPGSWIRGASGDAESELANEKEQMNTASRQHPIEPSKTEARHSTEINRRHVEEVTQDYMKTNPRQHSLLSHQPETPPASPRVGFQDIAKPDHEELKAGLGENLTVPSATEERPSIRAVSREVEKVAQYEAKIAPRRDSRESQEREARVPPKPSLQEVENPEPIQKDTKSTRQFSLQSQKPESTRNSQNVSSQEAPKPFQERIDRTTREDVKTGHRHHSHFQQQEIPKATPQASYPEGSKPKPTQEEMKTTPTANTLPSQKPEPPKLPQQETKPQQKHHKASPSLYQLETLTTSSPPTLPQQETTPPSSKRLSFDFPKREVPIPSAPKAKTPPQTQSYPQSHPQLQTQTSQFSHTSPSQHKALPSQETYPTKPAITARIQDTQKPHPATSTSISKEERKTPSPSPLNALKQEERKLLNRTPSFRTLVTQREDVKSPAPPESPEGAGSRMSISSIEGIIEKEKEKDPRVDTVNVVGMGLRTGTGMGKEERRGSGDGYGGGFGSGFGSGFTGGGGGVGGSVRDKRERGMESEMMDREKTTETTTETTETEKDEKESSSIWSPSKNFKIRKSKKTFSTRY